MSYKPNAAGMRELAQSGPAQDVALDGARRVAAAAKSDNRRGEYEAQPRTVTAGWRNERRAGAAAVETEPGLGRFRRSLLRGIGEAKR